MHFSKDFFNQDITTLSESVLLDYVIELDQLHNISKLKDIKNIKVAYKESLYAYQKILSDYSSISIKKILLQMNNNNIPFDKAFKNILGIELNKFESQIDEKIKESTITSILFNLPSILIFISSIKNGLQLITSSLLGLFWGGAHLTALDILTLYNSNWSVLEMLFLRFDKPDSYRAWYNMSPA